MTPVRRWPFAAVRPRWAKAAIPILATLLLLPIACDEDESTQPSSARIWRIEADGSGDVATIQAAVDTAAANDIIELADGIFVGPGNRDINFHGKSVVVRSRSGYAGTCVIDCQADADRLHRGFFFHTGEDTTAVVQDLTVRNGYVDYNGGGLLCDNFASPKFVGVVVESCHAERCGGGVDVTKSNAIVRDCVFRHNSARWGGGAASELGGDPQFRGCEFTENESHLGGGFYCERANSLLRDCIFRNNGGGAIRDAACQLGTTRFEGCTFIQDSSIVTSVQIACFDETISLTDCRIQASCSAIQGGIWCEACSLTIQHSTFSVRSVGTSITLAIYDSAARVTNCSLLADGMTCQGIVTDDSDVSLDRSIVCLPGQGVIVECGDESNITMSCCVIHAPDSASELGCSESQIGENGNRLADPLFCDPDNGDLRLAEGSPCSPDSSECGLIGALGVGCGR